MRNPSDRRRRKRRRRISSTKATRNRMNQIAEVYLIPNTLPRCTKTSTASWQTPTPGL
ncbi:unnamed protein product [Hydatigera taeniaeformis]|uniref:Uncharacterized protein n=1 Tax=Hydatigena taeniaeformis TaxID=6205 RepID=A0A0R3WWR7_HYDTA|nr:unnamed protein product [Hydatigera taeniaeformis]